MRGVLLLICLAMTAVAGTALAAPALRVESKVKMQGISMGDQRETEWTLRDRQCVDIEGTAGVLGLMDGPIPVHARTITRLDRQLTWQINYRDSTYTEETFAAAARTRQLYDSLGIRRAIDPLSKAESLEVTNGPGGVRVTHVRRWTKGFIGQSPVASAQADTAYVDSWESRGIPGTELYSQFRKTWAEQQRSVSAKQSATGSYWWEKLLQSSSDPSAYPTRTVVTLINPGLRELAAAFPAEYRDSLAREGFDVSRMMVRVEVAAVKIEIANADSQLFELPQGFKRKPSQYEEIQELMKLQQAAPPSPAPKRKR